MMQVRSTSSTSTVELVFYWQHAYLRRHVVIISCTSGGLLLHFWLSTRG
jgi:hypothetical protein